MITDTPAIVFKTVFFSESSLIVTLLTEKHGKIPVMARGARRNKNRFGGLLQPGAILEVSYYHKSTREVQNLRDVSQKLPTWRIQQDMEKMAIGLAALELSEQLCHEYEPMPDMYLFLADFLAWLHESKSSPRFLFPYIQYRMAQISGIGISLQLSQSAILRQSTVFPDSRDLPDSTETSEYIQGDAHSQPLDSAARVDIPDGTERHTVNEPVNEPQIEFPCYLNVESGCVTGKPDNGLSFGLTKSQGEYFRYIADGKKSRLLNTDFPVPDIKHLIHHLDTYFQFHLEGIRGRRSDAIFEQIL